MVIILPALHLCETDIGRHPLGQRHVQPQHHGSVVPGPKGLPVMPTTSPAGARELNLTAADHALQEAPWRSPSVTGISGRCSATRDRADVEPSPVPVPRADGLRVCLGRAEPGIPGPNSTLRALPLLLRLHGRLGLHYGEGSGRGRRWRGLHEGGEDHWSRCVPPTTESGPEEPHHPLFKTQAQHVPTPSWGSLGFPRQTGQPASVPPLNSVAASRAPQPPRHGGGLLRQQ
ncbi:hypothetical protein SAMN04488504_119105 [Myxococcus virescens]|uniref:Uncharacterized protein n=1 Tax=Myxococcus virescens TaxID=83456 RepID=A0ABY0N7U7_9BACT|nr:hypothetical protein SAMN04488504_119105 [Myxococcus virescens]